MKSFYFPVLNAYDDLGMDATYFYLCVVWMQILDSHIPTSAATCPQVEPDVDHYWSTTHAVHLLPVGREG